MSLILGRVAPLALVAGALALAGCGSDGSEGTGGGAGATFAPPSEEQLRGVPRPLAANIRQANEIIDGGEEALEAKLADLRGYPVVVNQWATWCDPCRAEFPLFRESAESHFKDVAFLGIDMQDSRSEAEEFLRELPVPYPHIFDPDAAAIRSLGGGRLSPTTAFVDESGEVAGLRQGAYPSRVELEADIDRYLLDSG